MLVGRYRGVLSFYFVVLRVGAPGFRVGFVHGDKGIRGLLWGHYRCDAAFPSFRW